MIFKVNTRATELLYSKIGDLLGLPSAGESQSSGLELSENADEDEEVAKKRVKLEQNEADKVADQMKNIQIFKKITENPNRHP